MNKILYLLMTIMLSVFVNTVVIAETDYEGPKESVDVLEKSSSLVTLSATCKSDRGDRCICKGACTAGKKTCQCLDPVLDPDRKAERMLSMPDELSAKCTSTDKKSKCNCPGGQCSAGTDWCTCKSSIIKR